MTRQQQLPKKLWWKVRTFKSLGRTSALCTEHTYRVQACSGEDACAIAEAFPLVIKVLGVTESDW